LTTEGTPYHPQIAIDQSGALLIAWDELADGRRQAVMARGSSVVPGGGFVRVEIPAGSQGSYPVVASTSEGFIAAWTDTSQVPSRIVVQRLP
jgi:hypothetical protein